MKLVLISCLELDTLSKKSFRQINDQRMLVGIFLCTKECISATSVSIELLNVIGKVESPRAYSVSKTHYTG